MWRTFTIRCTYSGGGHSLVEAYAPNLAFAFDIARRRTGNAVLTCLGSHPGR